MKEPDALERGTKLHKVMEVFVPQVTEDPSLLTEDHLIAVTREVLGEEVPWAEARILWLAKMARNAAALIDGERNRQAAGHPVGYEVGGRATLSGTGFDLTAKADRIDLDANGNALIYDYKTGQMSSPNAQMSFDLQLLLMAAMAERAAFHQIDPRHVVRAAFVGLGSDTKEVDAPLDKISSDEVWARFEGLIRRYLDDGQPFTARRAMFKSTDQSDYDHLARYGEWDIATPARKEPVE